MQKEQQRRAALVYHAKPRPGKTLQDISVSLLTTVQSVVYVYRGLDMM